MIFDDYDFILFTMVKQIRCELRIIESFDCFVEIMRENEIKFFYVT